MSQPTEVTVGDWASPDEAGLLRAPGSCLLLPSPAPPHSRRLPYRLPPCTCSASLPRSTCRPLCRPRWSNPPLPATCSNPRPTSSRACSRRWCRTTGGGGSAPLSCLRACSCLASKGLPTASDCLSAPLPFAKPTLAPLLLPTACSAKALSKYSDMVDSLIRSQVGAGLEAAACSCVADGAAGRPPGGLGCSPRSPAPSPVPAPLPTNFKLRRHSRTPTCRSQMHKLNGASDDARIRLREWELPEARRLPGGLCWAAWIGGWRLADAAGCCSLAGACSRRRRAFGARARLPARLRSNLTLPLCPCCCCGAAAAGAAGTGGGHGGGAAGCCACGAGKHPGRRRAAAPAGGAAAGQGAARTAAGCRPGGWGWGWRLPCAVPRRGAAPKEGSLGWPGARASNRRNNPCACVPVLAPAHTGAHLPGPRIHALPPCAACRRSCAARAWMSWTALRPTCRRRRRRMRICGG